MPIVSDAYVAPDWVNGTSPAIDATELNAMSETLECIPIANGGTGSTTAAAALALLGGIATSDVANKGSATRGVYFDEDGTVRQMTYSLGKSVPTDAIFFSSSDVESSGALKIAKGGTGSTSAANARTALGVPAKSDFTSKGDTNTPCYCNSSGVATPITALKIAAGGTGATNGADGLKNLFAAGKTILSSNQYGTTLPSSGTAGQLFFKKL